MVLKLYRTLASKGRGTAGSNSYMKFKKCGAELVAISNTLDRRKTYSCYTMQPTLLYEFVAWRGKEAEGIYGDRLTSGPIKHRSAEDLGGSRRLFRMGS